MDVLELLLCEVIFAEEEIEDLPVREPKSFVGLELGEPGRSCWVEGEVCLERFISIRGKAVVEQFQELCAVSLSVDEKLLDSVEPCEYTRIVQVVDSEPPPKTETGGSRSLKRLWRETVPASRRGPFITNAKRQGPAPYERKTTTA